MQPDYPAQLRALTVAIARMEAQPDAAELADVIGELILMRVQVAYKWHGAAA